jgi:signal transduction histidine kinase
VSDLNFRTLDRRTLAMAVGLCVVVTLTAYACVAFPRAEGRIAPIWLANGWVVAALLRSSGRRWPLFLSVGAVGYIVANLVAGDPVPVSISLSLSNALECLVCSWAVRRRCGVNLDIGRTGHLITFITAAVGASAISALVASGLLGLLAHTNFLRGLLAWGEADALGLLTLTPALLVLTQRIKTPVDWREGWTLVVLAVVAIMVFFVTHFPLLFLISAALTLPAWRMGLPGAVAGFVIVAAVGATAAFTGHGPVNHLDGAGRMVGLQVFLTVTFLTSVPLAVARDESERLKTRLRQALTIARTARGKAEQAAAVKTEFLANMSHELRTPLTSVVGFTRLAAEQSDLSALSRGYIDRVGEASRALLCAVNDILDFSKLEAGQVSLRPEPTAFEPLLNMALHLFTPQAAAKDLELRLEDATPSGLAVVVDPDRLRQVLLNLVGNAVKFTSDGQVTLRASYDEAAERLTIAVADTGPGIPADRLDRLFKRFSQVDGSLTRGHGGTGLGLAICKGIVEAMGGAIGATSVLGEGSLFSLTIPAARAQGVVAAEAVAEGGHVTCAGVRVLVVDDHQANRELVMLFLAAIEARVTQAVDGQDAVELAAGQPFDVILMDLRMPRLDGLGALARIRGGDGPNQSTPILAFTADVECVHDGRLEAQGFDGAVAKPVEPGPLIAAIAGVLAPPDMETQLLRVS